MKDWRRTSVGLAVVLAVSVAAAGQEPTGNASGFTQSSSEPETGLKIEVLVSDYAGVPAEALASAEHQAGRIYRRVGLAVEWLHCPLTAEENERRPVCELPSSPTRFYLRLLSNAMALRLPLGQFTSGFAWLPEEGGFGVTATVCADRAREIADRHKLRSGLMLGHLIAHELGHLLLGTAAHPVSGIMHVPWRTEELERIKQGGLLFLREEAEKIRKQLIARGTSERALQVTQVRTRVTARNGQSR